MALVYGVGENDVPGMSHSNEYMRWASMLQRCYDPRSLARDPSYLNTWVCKDWLVFSNFLAWAEKQNWHNKVLDKDLSGKDLYSPETCLLISPELNRYWTGARKIGLAGTNYEPDRGKWKASLKLPGPGRGKTLGRFDTEEEAHEVYMKEKIKHLTYFIPFESPEVAEKLREIMNRGEYYGN